MTPDEYTMLNVALDGLRDRMLCDPDEFSPEEAQALSNLYQRAEDERPGK